MPTEMKFDDLDLREEPGRGDAGTADPSGGTTVSTHYYCSTACTDSCCTGC